MHKTLLFIITLTCSLVLVANDSTEVRAQEPLQWTSIQRIPDYDDESESPHMITDHSGTVHAFNGQFIDNEYVILYRQWSLRDGWTKPIDIFLGNLRLLGAFMDDSGIVHLALFRGNELQADIYYTRGSIAEISRGNGARAWTKETLVARDAGPLSFGYIIGDGKDDLFVLFEGKKEGNGLYSIHSSDGGKTWTEPATIYLTYDEELWATRMSLAMDSQRKLHVVWSVWSSAGVSEEIWYARLEPDYTGWSIPTLLAQKDSDDYEADNPGIIHFKDELIVIYQDGLPATRMMRRSFDGGESWSEPVAPWPHIGEYGQPVLLIDNDEVLHVILGNRFGDNAHGMWHAIWLGDRWSKLEPIVYGPKTHQFDPTEPSAIISQGNILLATWDHDSAQPDNGIWYSYTKLDAPELPVVPLSAVTTPTPIPAVDPTATPVPPTPSHRPASSVTISGANSETISENPSAPLILGLIPVTLLIVATVIVNRVKR